MEVAMVPPGDALEFRSSQIYRQRIGTETYLDQAIQNAIKSRPEAGLAVAGFVRELLVSFDGESFLVFYTKKGNRIGLTAVFHSEEETLIASKRDELKNLFRGEKP
jgi:hypothetical protein